MRGSLGLSGPGFWAEFRALGTFGFRSFGLRGLGFRIRRRPLNPKP